MNELCILRRATVEAVTLCQDADLLDLVFKLLLDGTGGHPVEPYGLEVNHFEDYSGNPPEHRLFPVSVLRGVEHPSAIPAKVGNGRAPLSAVCGGADRVSRAA